MPAPRLTSLLFALALVVAVLGARPYAGSWNDGSRLAAVESLLERGTLAIDDSVFVCPGGAIARGHSPYPADGSLLRQSGTQDKMFIRGHYHSDKPPVISVVMAALYAPGYWVGLLPSPGERPDQFAWILTLLTSVPAFALALWCMMRLGRLAGLDGWAHTLWFGAFALSTFALAYTRHVNNHILQLAVAAGWCLMAVRLAQDLQASGGGQPPESVAPDEVRFAQGVDTPRSPAHRGLLLGMGLLLGFGYNLDLGSGPLLFAAAVALVVLRTRRLLPGVIVGLGAAPWIVACHAMNLAIGGVAGPLNAVPDHFDWPGSPFGTNNMTGVLRHSPLNLAVYALGLLFGKHGVIVHNLPLVLAIPATFAVLTRRSPLWLELLATLGWCGATWLLYALMSNNYGGACCSVRWFVPFLAPGFFLLAVYLKQCPNRLGDLAVLASGGTVLGVIMWLVGPWTLRLVPGLWPVVGATVLVWLVVACLRGRAKEKKLEWEEIGAAAEDSPPLTHQFQCPAPKHMTPAAAQVCQ